MKAVVRVFIRFVSALLRWSKLSIENRITLTNCILDKLQVIPTQDIVYQGEDGVLYVGGVAVDVESKIQMRDRATAALANSTLKVIRDQVAVRAVAMGIHNGDTTEKMYFGRAAIWYHGQLEEILKIFAADEND